MRAQGFGGGSKGGSNDELTNGTNLYLQPVARMLAQTDVWAYCLCLVALGNLLGECGTICVTGYIQECLALRLRRDAFGACVRQEIGFFDDPENPALGLTDTLARHARRVTQTTGEALAIAVFGACAACMGLP